MLHRALIALPILCAPTLAVAEPVPEAPAPALRMSLDVDPMVYAAYGGWGFYAGIRPAATGQWRFRVGAHAATLPSVAVETNDNNKGWDEHIDIALTAAVDRNFGQGRGGWFAGGVTGFSNLTFTAPGGGDVDLQAAVVGVEGGYRWFPFKRLGLTVTPHLAALFPLYTSNDATVGTMTYDQFPVIPIAQVWIGYEPGILK